MALSANKERKITRPDLALTMGDRMNVAASLEIFNGAILSIDANGDAAIASSSLPCAGIAANYYNNTVASATTDKPLLVHYNMTEELTLTGVTAADLGSLVYATDDNTLTLTPNTCIVGRIVAVKANDLIDVEVTLV